MLCENREYQKTAIRTAVIYLSSGLYSDLESLVRENYPENSELQKRYKNVDEYIDNLQIKDRLFANIDMATGTGKSYVIYGIAQILLAEGLIKRVLVLCPSLTIEKGLTEKFNMLAANKALKDALPDTANTRNPRIISADDTIKSGFIVTGKQIGRAHV